MTDNKLMRIADVLSATAMKRTTLYQAIQRGEFPAPRKIGRRAVAWRRTDIERWISERPPALAHHLQQGA